MDLPPSMLPFLSPSASSALGSDDPLSYLFPPPSGDVEDHVEKHPASMPSSAALATAALSATDPTVSGAHSMPPVPSSMPVCQGPDQTEDQPSNHFEPFMASSTPAHAIFNPSASTPQSSYHHSVMATQAAHTPATSTTRFKESLPKAVDQSSKSHILMETPSPIHMQEPLVFSTPQQTGNKRPSTLKKNSSIPAPSTPQDIIQVSLPAQATGSKQNKSLKCATPAPNQSARSHHSVTAAPVTDEITVASPVPPVKQEQQTAPHSSKTTSTDSKVVEGKRTARVRRRYGRKDRSLEAMKAIATNNAPEVTLTDADLINIGKMQESEIQLSESRQIYGSLVLLKRTLSKFGYRVSALHVEAVVDGEPSALMSQPFDFVLRKKVKQKAEVVKTGDPKPDKPGDDTSKKPDDDQPSKTDNKKPSKTGSKKGSKGDNKKTGKDGKGKSGGGDGGGQKAKGGNKDQDLAVEKSPISNWVLENEDDIIEVAKPIEHRNEISTVFGSSSYPATGIDSPSTSLKRGLQSDYDEYLATVEEVLLAAAAASDANVTVSTAAIEDAIRSSAVMDIDGGDDDGAERPRKRGKFMNRSETTTQAVNTSETDGKVRYACAVCCKVMTDMESTVRHFRHVHQEEKPFTCPRCGGFYSSEGTLWHHIRNVHSGKPRKYKCDHCDATYDSYGAKTRHEHGTHHSDDAQFVCKFSDCLRSFHFPAHLESHATEHHGGYRPFVCLRCPSNFPSANGLIRHEREVHERPRAYACSCSKAYSKRCHLKRHLQRVHKMSPERVEEEMNKQPHPGTLHMHPKAAPATAD